MEHHFKLIKDSFFASLFILFFGIAITAVLYIMGVITLENPNDNMSFIRTIFINGLAGFVLSFIVKQRPILVAAIAGQLGFTFIQLFAHPTPWIVLIAIAPPIGCYMGKVLQQKVQGG